MKTLYRIFVILFVAALLGGMMYAAVEAGGAVQVRERGELEQERGGAPGENQEGGAIFPLGALRSAILISLIGVPFFLWRKKR